MTEVDTMSRKERGYAVSKDQNCCLNCGSFIPLDSNVSNRMTHTGGCRWDKVCVSINYVCKYHSSVDPQPKPKKEGEEDA